MKKNIAVSIAVLGALALAGPALAGDLINKDSRSYDIRVKNGSSTMSTSISGGTTKSGLCSDDCTVTISGDGVVDGYETATSDGDDDLVIRDGKIAAD